MNQSARITMTTLKCRFASILLASVFSLLPAAGQDQPRPKDSGKPVKIDPSYQKLADETGGQVYVLDRNSAEQLGAVLALSTSPHKQEVLAVHGMIAGERTYQAPLGGGNQHLIISATGVTSVEVTAPSGNVIGTANAGVRYVKLRNGGIYAVETPEAGSWDVRLRGSGDFSLKITAIPERSSGATQTAPEAAKSGDIELFSFEFQEMAGRPGHEGLFKIAGFPVAGRSYPVEAKMSGEYRTVRFEFRNPEGGLIQVLQLQKRGGEGADEKTYEGEATIPAGPFLVYATGVDVRGYRYQRVQSTVIRPQLFTVSAPRYAEWTAGEQSTCAVSIKNFGPPDTFKATIVDVKNYLSSAKEITFALATNETREISVTLDVPAEATSDMLVITAARVADPNANNHAVVNATITKPQ